MNPIYENPKEVQTREPQTRATPNRAFVREQRPAYRSEHSPNSQITRRLGISTKICPRCTEEVAIESEKCSHCGVVFFKMIEGPGPATFQLMGEWAKVIKNWHNESQHDNFLRACRKQNELVYGISCYGRILKEEKDNKKAQEMIKRMEALTWFFEEELSLPKKFAGKNTLQNFWAWMIKSHTFDALSLSVVLCLLIYFLS